MHTIFIPLLNRVSVEAVIRSLETINSTDTCKPALTKRNLLSD